LESGTNGAATALEEAHEGPRRGSELSVRLSVNPDLWFLPSFNTWGAGGFSRRSRQVEFPLQSRLRRSVKTPSAQSASGIQGGMHAAVSRCTRRRTHHLLCGHPMKILRSNKRVFRFLSTGSRWSQHRALQCGGTFYAIDKKTAPAHGTTRISMSRPGQ
jgi:hypothetical protein